MKRADWAVLGLVVFWFAWVTVCIDNGWQAALWSFVAASAPAWFFFGAGIARWGWRWWSK